MLSKGLVLQNGNKRMVQHPTYAMVQSTRVCVEEWIELLPNAISSLARRSYPKHARTSHSKYLWKAYSLILYLFHISYLWKA